VLGLNGHRHLRKLIYLLFVAASAPIGWIKSNPRLATFVADLKSLKAFGDTDLHESMLSDTLRVDRYREGISRIVKDGDVVVDLGTGSGILAFFAAKKAAKVHAIEHSGVIKLARKIADENDIRNVEFHHCNSRQFRLDGRADVIIHEQIGNCVFDENMIESILDLRRRVLKDGGRIVPNRFEVYLEPIEMMDGYHTPYMWEFNIDGITFQSTKSAANVAPGRGALFSEYHRTDILAGEAMHMLCDPKPIMEFDLETMNESDLPRSAHYENTAVRDGRIQGLCVAFRTHFDDQTDLEVFPAGKQTNWSFAMFRLEEHTVRMGQRIEYDIEFGDVRDYLTWRLTWVEPEHQAAAAE